MPRGGGSQHTQHTAHSTAPIDRDMLYLAFREASLLLGVYATVPDGWPKNSGNKHGASPTPVASGPVAYTSALYVKDVFGHSVALSLSFFRFWLLSSV